MSQQEEILKSVSLLDEDGNILNPGFGKRNHFIYNKENISVSRWRLKEWNYYQISNGKYVVILNFFDISYASAVSCEICDLETGKVLADTVIELFTVDKDFLDANADKPYRFEYKKSGRHVIFNVDNKGHSLFFKGKAKNQDFIASLFAQKDENHESITSATPFDRPGYFFLTQKLNCMPTTGLVRIGKKVIEFDKKNTFTVMDWGRGIWPYENMWYWANGSTVLNGKLFGFEITFGFGRDDYSSQTALFYDGKCHKIGKVTLEEDPEKVGFMNQWHFTSEHGRLDLTMTPSFDKNVGIIFLNLIGMKSHQVHGKWNGFVILDDGTRLEIKDMYAFCEKVRNKW